MELQFQILFSFYWEVVFWNEIEKCWAFPSWLDPSLVMVSSVAVSRAVQVQAVMSVQWGAVRCSTEVRGWRHAEEVPAAYLTRSSRPAALFPERPAPRYEVRHSEHRAAHPCVLLSDARWHEWSDKCKWFHTAPACEQFTRLLLLLQT